MRWSPEKATLLSREAARSSSFLRGHFCDFWKVRTSRRIRPMPPNSVYSPYRRGPFTNPRGQPPRRALGDEADGHVIALADADADVGVDDALAPFEQVAVAELLDLDVGGLPLPGQFDALGFVMSDDLHLLPL